MGVGVGVGVASRMPVSSNVSRMAGQPEIGRWSILSGVVVSPWECLLKE